MFCYHCQETKNNQFCNIVGVCGKSEEVSNLQDLFIHSLKGLGFYGAKARELGIIDKESDLFVAQGLFAMITNVNFDPERFVDLIKESVDLRNKMRDKFLAAYQEEKGLPFSEALPEAASWQYSAATLEEFEGKGAEVGVMSPADMDEDLRSLRELILYGLKGLGAYTEHAYMLGYSDTELFGFLHEALAFTANEHNSVDDYVAMAMKCGQYGVKSMALLDEAHTTTYGHPEATNVNIGVQDKPGILITGHDMHDMEDLLAQTAGSGVDVYTNGEMLPAHAYPAFKKYDHLVGNYGGAWWQQQKDFAKFNGPILATSNCIQKPMPKYADKFFTTGMVGWPDMPHIPDREAGQRKDFSAIIEKARQCAAPTPLEEGEITIGFAHNAVLSVADKIVEAIKAGLIKRFVVMAGCDGHQRSRRYYTEVAQGLPDDALILTAGCAKYRYNKLDLGDIGGIPRVLDAGQCNDSYSLVTVAMKLAEVFEVDHVNDLPISYDIAWYEQKAVIVLLSLLSLNVKKIRLGPTLPAFLSPNVINVLVDKFELQAIGSVEEDLEAIMAGN